MASQWKLMYIIFFIIQHVHSQEEFSWQQDRNGMVFSTGCEYIGDDWYRRPSNTMECSEKCYNNSECTHFSWKNLEDLGGTCFLKRNVAGGTRPKVVENSVCGHRGLGKKLDWHNDNRGQLLWARGCDFEHMSIETFRQSPKKCLLKCLERPECSHFSWNWDKNGTCLLKQQGTTESEPIMMSQEYICGYKTQRKFEFDENHNLISSFCDFEGKTFMDESTKTAHDCSELCMDNTSCTHFSYTDENGGHCFLKNGVPERTRPIFTRNFTQCGFKYASPDQTKTDCQVFTERRGNICNVNVEAVVDKRKPL